MCTETSYTTFSPDHVPSARSPWLPAIHKQAQAKLVFILAGQSNMQGAGAIK